LPIFIFVRGNYLLKVAILAADGRFIRIERSRSASFSLEVIHPDAAGIDIGNESHYAAAPPSRGSSNAGYKPSQ
jgi:hypothetical protein